MCTFLVGALLMIAPPRPAPAPAKSVSIATRVEAVRALAAQAVELLRADGGSPVSLSLADELHRAAR